MLRHGLLLFFRNIKKGKSTFLINVVGLSTALAFSMFITLWVLDELGMDKFHEKDDRLYKVLKNVTSDDGITTMEYTPGLLATALREEVPEIAQAVSVVPPTRFSSNGTLSYEEVKVKANGQYVGSGFFEVFSHNFKSGTGEALFLGKYNIIITNSLAIKLFGTVEKIVGKTMKWDHEMLKGSYTVVAVIEDLPPSSSEDFDVLFNYSLFLEQNPKLKNWGNSDPATYLTTKEGIDIPVLEKKLAKFIKTKNPNSKESLFLQKYSDGYLHGNYQNGKPVGGKVIYVRLFAILGIFLLVIACINYMNLSTARFVKRLKEVGIKKVLGANRKTLFFQYLGEALLITLISAVIATLLVFLLLQSFNELTGKNLAFHFHTSLVWITLGIVILTGLLAGIYPSLFIVGFEPLGSSRKTLPFRNSEVLTRKTLVIFQFTISVIMIVGVLVVYNQTELVLNKNLGYNRENIIYFEKGSNHETGEYEQNLESFLNAIRNVPGVVSASNFRHSIINRDGGTSDINWPGKPTDSKLVFTDFPAGYDFIETMGINLSEGSSISKELHSPNSSVIFNETAIAQMGLKEPVGKRVTIWGEEKEVIGVVRDFHFQSFYEEIKPLFFDFSVNPRASNIIVRMQGASHGEILERLEKLYREHNPGLPFEYSFLDNDYQKFYESEKRASLLLQYLASMAILVSCLGMFGLAAFTTERRRKEISVRKVLGQSASQIIGMISRDFAKLILTSIVIATPIIYLLAKDWLSSFAYHISLGVWYFVSAAVAVFVLAMLTVGLHAARAASINPAISLREE